MTEYVCLCMICVGGNTCHRTCVEITGQLYRLCSLFPPFCGFCRGNSGDQCDKCLCLIPFSLVTVLFNWLIFLPNNSFYREILKNQKGTPDNNPLGQQLVEKTAPLVFCTFFWQCWISTLGTLAYKQSTLAMSPPFPAKEFFPKEGTLKSLNTSGWCVCLWV